MWKHRLGFQAELLTLRKESKGGGSDSDDEEEDGERRIDRANIFQIHSLGLIAVIYQVAFFSIAFKSFKYFSCLLGGYEYLVYAPLRCY